MKNRIDLLNSLIKHFKFKNYLEIGTQKNVCLRQINCDYKVGVDPNPLIFPKPIIDCNLFYQTTSNLFFKMNKQKFDLIFIDGLHESEQVYKDIKNSINCLTDKGIIVCHDMNPKNESEQRIPRETKHWNGDCWKAWVRLRSEISNKSMFIVDIDEGCGIITQGIQTIIDIPDNISYKWLEENRQYALNLVSIKNFEKWLK